jgi:integrase
MASPATQKGRLTVSRPVTRGRKATGNVKEHPNKDGTVTFSLRVRWNGQRPTVRLGNELEGWNRALADLKLDQVLAEIDAGTWRPPAPEIPDEDRDPGFHLFATVWLERQAAELDESTVRDYEHTLQRYILPEFRGQRLTEISYEDVRRWRERLQKESEHLLLAKKNGLRVLDRHGEAKRPFGASKINEAIRLLGQILDRAVESDHYLVDRNPAKGRKGLRIKTPAKPPRNHLEADEVLSLIQAADLIDQGVTPTSLKHAKRARELRAQGKTWAQVGAEMGCAEATAIYRSRIKPNQDAPRRRRAVIVMLAFTGTRAGEHTQLTWGRIDETHGRIVLDDAKTDAGVREIHMSPFVREEVALYKTSLPNKPAPDDPAFPVRTGSHDDRHNLLRRLSHVVSIANELRRDQGLAPLPKRITPHTFRRTFITLSFQAGNDLVFVQTQAGHADWKTTLDIYTQQSSRSVDASIRQLLDVFLGEPEGAEEARRARAARAGLHAIPELAG